MYLVPYNLLKNRILANTFEHVILNTQCNNILALTTCCWTGGEYPLGWVRPPNDAILHRTGYLPISRLNLSAPCKININRGSAINR